MSAEILYQHLGLPDACLLQKRLYKRMFYEQAQLTAADKKAISQDVSNITWQYTLKPSTIQVAKYEDEKREYLEIAVVEVDLKSRRRATRIAEIVQRAIPYPVLLVQADSDGICVSVAHKRFSLAEQGAIVADDFLSTPWMDAPLAYVDTAFLESLALRNLSTTNFLALYQDLTRRLLARNCADLTGRFELTAQSEEATRHALTSYKEVEREISGLRRAIQKEPQFAAKVDLNMRIKKLQTQLSEIVGAL